ncbi:UNVERIFIED_CONTAM: hypothetical protein RMT77_001236 [Armadillidium vulgare]
MKVRGWSWATSWPVVGLWTAVTLSVTLTSLGALFTPAWYVREGINENNNDSGTEWHESEPRPYYTASFGVWAWCLGWENAECAPVGESVAGEKSDSPSVVWVMVGAVYGGGAALLGVTGIAGMLTPFLPSTQARSAFAHVSSNIQAAAVSLQALGLMLYPLGLGSSFTRGVCGNKATIYSAGSCHIGYAYMLALVSTALAAYCPVLARLITYKDYSNYLSNMNYL